MASEPQRGTTDAVLSLLRRYHLPLTRENYLNLAYMGEPPAHLSQEEEEGLPPEIRLPPPAAHHHPG